VRAGGLAVVLASIAAVAAGSAGADAAAAGAAPVAEQVDAAAAPDRRLYVITDSVGLGAAPAIRSAFAGWQVTIDADPGEFTETLERKYVAPRLTTSPWAFGDHAVVAAGYNYPYWDPDRFDRSVDSMIATLERAGGAARALGDAARGPTAGRQPVGVASGGAVALVPGHRERPPRAGARAPPQPVPGRPGRRSRTGRASRNDAIHLNNEGAALYATIVRRSVDEATTALADGGVARINRARRRRHRRWWR
jgi:hypothetical protein